MSVPDTFWTELDHLGESRVRESLESGIFRGTKGYYAQEWLRSQEFARAQAAGMLDRRKTPRFASAFGALIATIALIGAGAIHWLVLK